MTQKTRDYKAEYRRRIESGKARGYSRAQASGHPDRNKGEAPISETKSTAYMVATSPCVGCICNGTPEVCRKLEGWLRGKGWGVGVSV